MSLADSYLDQLQALLPPGRLARDPNAVLTRLLGAFADGLARVHLRADNLVDEEDPRTTLELLPDYERVTSLPDPCLGPAPDIPTRRAQLSALMLLRGSLSIPHLIGVAASYGFTITITKFPPSVAEGMAAEDGVTEDDWAFAFQVNAPLTTEISEFQAEASGAEDALATWGNTTLECVINRYRPGYATPIYAYT